MDISDKSFKKSPYQSEGVKTLLGDPKSAIIKLAWPMIIAMSAHTIYNFVDAIWVSGLGYGALAAVGFFFPFFFLSMAISTGIGVGGGAAISRRIGANDKVGADNVGVHTMVLMVLLAISFTIPFLIFAESIFLTIGAGEVIDDTLAYSRIMFGGTIIIFFSMIATSILRAEGDAKRSMWVMMAGAIINIFLDPIFIYTFGLGIAGAAWATMISMSISSLILYYWLFVKKDTFVKFNFKNFRWNRDILNDILKVGIPASVMQVSMSLTMLIMNIIIVFIAGFKGVSVYAVGWRVVTVAILPLIGMATAVTAVAGAAFGAKNHQKLKISFYYAIRLGLTIAIVVAFVTFIFAEQITAMFTYSEETKEISGDIVRFLQIICLFYPGVAFGMFSSSMFQGTGKGTNALVVTILRTLVLAPPLTLLFAFYLQLDLVGVWWGLVVANITGSLIAFSWARFYIGRLKDEFAKESESFKKSIFHG
jgi:putative MATE family efflux protein